MFEDYFTHHSDAVLDLHGQGREEALHELQHFLVWAKSQDLRFVRVITGKGSGSEGRVPVVRNAVLAYLNMEGYRYEFAGILSGGDGALHITL